MTLAEKKQKLVDLRQVRQVYAGLGTFNTGFGLIQTPTARERVKHIDALIAWGEQDVAKSKTEPT